MCNNDVYNKIANKLVYLNDKFIEPEPVIKMINIWIKEKDYEMVPIINILNNKMIDIMRIFEE